ncbi:hypothetical protein GT003_17775 [Paenibacillus sacheonensis]|uniref:Fibronectin type-III domain-containing protein n=2 Tax=Paenibacillus sacheonensis TaxID=742054 RepID=A0A7X4YQT3_9BACL|nr:hypothetical protein [Paenibacillus sacheonensis]
MLFDYIEGAHNQDTVTIDFLGGGYTYVGPGVTRHDAATNVIMNHLYIHDHDANGMGSYCGDSMALNGVKNLTLMNSIFDEAGGCASPSGTAAIYTAFTYDSNFFNNLMINMPNTGSPDQVGIDYEHSVNGLHVNNNYFGNNAGWGPSILAFNSYIGSVIPNQLFNLEINGNVMKGNGGGSVRISGSGVTPTGSIQNNLSSDSPFIYTDTGGTSSGMTVSNNKTLSSSDIYHAGYQFSGTQGGSNWSYQSYNGSSWSNLAYYDSAAKAWQTNSSTAVPNVKQFDQTPGTSGKIARAWTAPSSGTISIRGRVLKSDISGGDGITTRITKNGTRIWPSGGDQSIGYNDLVGAEQALDSISVSAGDVIRFEVDGSGNNTADAASWAPAIAYTAFGGGGSLPSTPTGLSASGGNGQVALGWSAASGATSYNVKRSTSSGGSFSNVATGVTSTSYTDTGVTNGTTYYYVVSAVNSIGESGNSSQASATPSSSGTSYAAEWNYDTASNFEGWSMANDVTGTVSGGSLHVTMTGGDPYIISPNNVGVSAANNHIYVRAQNNTSSTSMQIYFQNTGDGGFTEAHSKTFTINANSGYTTYDVDMTGVSGWTGTIKQLRVDAFSGSGSIDFDSIKIGGSGGGGTVPSAPTGLTATGGNAQASLSWSAVSGATSYNVKRSTTSGGSYTNVATGVTSTSYTNTGLTNGTTYYYVVSAVNSAGEGTNSSQASATPSSGSSYAAEWNFDTAGNFEGWAMQNDVSGTVSGGSLHVSMTGGSDPYILSPGSIGVSASNGHLYLRLQNNTSSTNLQVYFQNTGDSGFTEAHSKTFSINANSGYTTYDIDMSSVSGWTGTIKQLRIDEYSTSGSIDFDSVKIGN